MVRRSWQAGLQLDVAKRVAPLSQREDLVAEAKKKAKLRADVAQKGVCSEEK